MKPKTRVILEMAIEQGVRRVDALPYGENPDELTCDQILENNQ
jgi:hypothetical protein